ncbi:MAG: prepilin-type N-terminal cleavage/methylation domain-containing protein [Thermoleophilia bacterium]|nr:prepilin-type N-terminal cleavage/methylation domain-containing protein [Thermoleophilia bacterium]
MVASEMATRSTRFLTTRRVRPGRDAAGFTLVEALVTAVLIAVVLLAIFTIWFGLQRTYAFTEEDMKAQQEARNALSEMVELIRTARRPNPAPSENLDLVIVTADSNSLVLWSDVDRDPQHDLELVRFRVDFQSRTLYRDVSQTGDITFSSGTSVRLVSSWVTNDETLPLFTYIDSKGITLPTPVPDPVAIRQVVIDLRIDVEVGKSPIAHELRSTVQPRNLRQY